MKSSATNPIPEGMHSITPHLICAGAADAIELYKKAFGATETSRLPGPDGKIIARDLRGPKIKEAVAAALDKR